MESSRVGIKATKPIRIKVLSAEPPREYTNANDKKMVVVEGVIGDCSGFKKPSCYNRLAFPFVKENNSLMILNAISKTNEIVATGESKLIMIPEVKVPEEVVAASKSATSTSKAKHVAKVVDLLDQKEGTVFNIIGKVIEVITIIFLANNFNIQIYSIKVRVREVRKNFNIQIYSIKVRIREVRNYHNTM